MRLDSTVTAAPIHEPSDSSLLWDAVRVMVRLLKRADTLVGGLAWRDHCGAAKKRARKVQFTRVVQLYRELIAITRTTLAYLNQASECLAVATNPSIAPWQIEAPFIKRLIPKTNPQARESTSAKNAPSRAAYSIFFAEHEIGRELEAISQ